MTILQVMFFSGPVGKLLKLLHLYRYRNLYKEKGGRECVCERVSALERDTFCAYKFGMESYFIRLSPLSITIKFAA